MRQEAASVTMNPDINQKKTTFSKKKDPGSAGGSSLRLPNNFPGRKRINQTATFIENAGKNIADIGMLEVDRFHVDDDAIQ